MEEAERGKDARLAYSFDIALQNEFSLEENIALARQFLSEYFVSRGLWWTSPYTSPTRRRGFPQPPFPCALPHRPIREDLMKLYQVKSTVDTARRRQEQTQHRDRDMKR